MNILTKLQKRTKRFLSKPFGRGLAAVLLTWGIYLSTIWLRILFYKDGNIISGWIGAWCDWPAHMIYAAHFAYKPISLWLSNPIIINQPFSYHFLADAISGWFIKLNTGPVFAFIAPSIILTLLLLIILYVFYFQFLRSAVQSFISVSIFICSGGLGFFYYLADLIKEPSLATIIFPPRQYTHVSDSGIEMINIFTGMLIPQRAILLCLPVILFILVVLQKWKNKKFAGVPATKLLLMGLLIGIVPIIHLHFFVSLIVLTFFLALSSYRHWRSWITIATPAISVSTLIYTSLFLNSDLGENLIAFMPIWHSPEVLKGLNFFSFWWVNWGLFLPLSLISVIAFRYYKKPLVIGALAIFLLGNYAYLQNQAFDNAKLLIWSYLVLSAPLARFIVFIWKDTPKLKILSATILFLITASGFIDIWRLNQTNKLEYFLWAKEDMTLAKKFRQLDSAGKVVLTATNHNHWVPSFTGYQVLLSYRGWLGGYGYNYSSVYEDMTKIYSGSNDTKKLIKKYNIKYTVVGPAERNEFYINEDFFSNHFKPIVSNLTNTVYIIK